MNFELSVTVSEILQLITDEVQFVFKPFTCNFQTENYVPFHVLFINSDHRPINGH